MGMNRGAETGGILWDNVIYLILLIVFFAGMMAFIYSKMNGAAVWGDYYVKEIVKIIDSSRPGDEIIFDVHKATEIAQKNNIPSSKFDRLFIFTNLKNEVCVKLSLGKASCYNYFNDVGVGAAPPGDRWVYLAEVGDKNRLHFNIFPKGELNK